MTGIMRNFIEKYDHTQELTIPKIHENYINATKILRRLTLQKDVLKLNIPHTMYRNHDITNLLAHVVELRLRSIIKHCIITSKLRLDKKRDYLSVQITNEPKIFLAQKSKEHKEQVHGIDNDIIMTDTTNIITKDNDKFISDNIKLKNQSSLRYPNDKIVREDLLNV